MSVFVAVFVFRVLIVAPLPLFLVFPKFDSSGPGDDFHEFPRTKFWAFLAVLKDPGSRRWNLRFLRGTPRFDRNQKL